MLIKNWHLTHAENMMNAAVFLRDITYACSLASRSFVYSCQVPRFRLKQVRVIGLKLITWLVINKTTWLPYLVLSWTTSRLDREPKIGGRPTNRYFKDAHYVYTNTRSCPPAKWKAEILGFPTVYDMPIYIAQKVPQNAPFGPTFSKIFWGRTPRPPSNIWAFCVLPKSCAPNLAQWASLGGALLFWYDIDCTIWSVKHTNYIPKEGSIGGAVPANPSFAMTRTKFWKDGFVTIPNSTFILLIYMTRIMLKIGLKIFVVAMPIEGWARVAAPILLLAWHRLFKNIIYDVSSVKFWKVVVIPKEGWARPCVSILLLVWQRQRP